MHPTFVMLSGYGLYPPIDQPSDPASAALSKALDDIARDHVAGIVYGTLGALPYAGVLPPGVRTANAYNTALFNLARARGATTWLQLRYYDNQIDIAGTPTNLTAADIISDQQNRTAFLDAAMATVDTYEQTFPTACTVILGEEETMYHSKMGGGLFWAGKAMWDNPAVPKGGAGNAYLQHSTALDNLFVQNFSTINTMLINAIRQKYPRCSIGIHIGHDPLLENIGNTPVYQLILAKLPPLDFTFYDLYEKISKTDADFFTKLTDRVTLLKSLRQKVYYEAQLHTTNNFGSGDGRTPSKSEIDETLALAEKLGVDGFGYYSKNAAPTICTRATIAQGYWQDPRKPADRIATTGCNPSEDLDPLDPNTSGQQMVYQNSLARWQYGLARLVSFEEAKS